MNNCYQNSNCLWSLKIKSHILAVMPVWGEGGAFHLWEQFKRNLTVTWQKTTPESLLNSSLMQKALFTVSRWKYLEIIDRQWSIEWILKIIISELCRLVLILYLKLLKTSVLSRLAFLITDVWICIFTNTSALSATKKKFYPHDLKIKFICLVKSALKFFYFSCFSLLQLFVNNTFCSDNQ